MHPIVQLQASHNNMQAYQIQQRRCTHLSASCASAAAAGTSSLHGRRTSASLTRCAHKAFPCTIARGRRRADHAHQPQISARGRALRAWGQDLDQPTASAIANFVVRRPLTLCVEPEERHQESGDRGSSMEGTLTVRPLRVDLVGHAADLLVDAFVATSMRMRPFARFLRRQIYDYLETRLRRAPATVVLTATWCPQRDHDVVCGADDGDGSMVAACADDGAARALPLLLGCVEVSFDASTRQRFATLEPPFDCAYMCNMAVAPAYRRRGIARELVSAVEQLCLLRGKTDVFLHLRFQDDAARCLYACEGFVAVAQDMWLLQLLGADRRYLMRKNLKQHEEEATV